MELMTGLTERQCGRSQACIEVKRGHTNLAINNHTHITIKTSHLTYINWIDVALVESTNVSIREKTIGK